MSRQNAQPTPKLKQTVKVEDYLPGLARRLPEGAHKGLDAVFEFWSRLGVLRLVIAGLLLAAIALPIGPARDEVLVRTGFYALAALGLNVVVGLAGLLDLGYVAFLMIGAYATALVTESTATAHPFIAHAWVGLPIAVIVAMITGIILGLPTLRLRGDYLAIVTLGFHEIVRQTAKNLSVVNGARGVGDIPHPDFVLARPQLTVVGVLIVALGVYLLWRAFQRRDEQADAVAFVVSLITGAALALVGVWLAIKESVAQEFSVLEPEKYWFILVIFMMLGVFMIGRLKDSRIGRAWEAIREDEVAAEAMGVPVVKMKLYAFSIGASTSGLAGWALAVKVGFINPDTFLLLYSILVLCAVVIGGIGSSLGALIGAAIVFGLPELLRELGTEEIAGFSVQTGRIAIFGVLLVVMMIFRPGGLISSARRRAELAGGADIASESTAPTIPGES